ncbi:hypothetical protein VNO77_03835 [Canavalia gladiata]|uniref:Uncharacterized protein n=1 Tax=Canavalia gladiata TaxID=3824 RepID=A0AAN9N0J8_CANGL
MNATWSTSFLYDNKAISVASVGSDAIRHKAIPNDNSNMARYGNHTNSITRILVFSLVYGILWLHLIRFGDNIIIFKLDCTYLFSIQPRCYEVYVLAIGVPIAAFCGPAAGAVVEANHRLADIMEPQAIDRGNNVDTVVSMDFVQDIASNIVTADLIALRLVA